MKNNRKSLFKLLVALAAASAFAGVKEEDWVKFEYPDAWVPGAPMEFKVTLKGEAPEDQLVSVHMHWMKQKGFGGMLSYKPGQYAVSGKTLTFVHKPKMKEGAVSASACVFLAPDADFKRKTKVLQVPIPLDLSTPPPPEPKKWTPPPYAAKPDTVTFKKSMLWVEEAPEVVRVGEPFKVKVHYIFDESDTWGDKPTSAMLQPLGPWIDNPDGVINPRRMHVGIPGLKNQTKDVKPGEGVLEYDCMITESFRYNSLFYRCFFRAPNHEDWPWEWRGAYIKVERPNDLFFINATANGGLFTYGDTPTFKIEWTDKAAAAESGTLTVKDVKGEVVLTKTVACNPASGEQTVALDGFNARGCFSAALKIDGVGEEYCFFGTIPEFKREAGRRTPFGITNIYDEDSAALGERLGFSYTRLFTSWRDIEPAKDVWLLDRLDRAVAVNSAHGLSPWICLYDPPARVLPEGMWATRYEPSPFDLNEWSKALELLATRYDGKLYGFEWLNEIVPGSKCKDPAKEYVEICKTGYQTVKAVRGDLVCQLAGGLWPHNYLVDCLNAGVGEWIDLLPVHYSNYDGVTTAWQDLELRGLEKKVGASDNETAKGMATWNMTPKDALSKSLLQCYHVMTRWPDELCAGSKMIVYFGGAPDPCGNWSYLLDSKNPRPVAVTLAVVQEKIGYAKAVGKFFYDGCPVQLFERDGKAIAFVAAPGEKDKKLRLPVGEGARLHVTDYLGNESDAADGEVSLGDMPVIVEGLDLDAMKLCAALRIGISKIPAAEPQVVAEADSTIPVPVTVTNPFAEEKTFTLVPETAEWGEAETAKVTLASGESKSFEIVCKAKVGAKVSPVRNLSISVSADGVAAQVRPFVLYVINPSAIGNIVKDAEFDGSDKIWRGAHETVAAPMPGDADNKAMRFKGAGKGAYKSSWQNVEIPVPGQSYLYTCWMNSDSMFCGSNVSETYEDGTSRKYIALRIFSIGSQGSKSWRYLAKRFDTRADTKSVTLVPVGDGDGSFMCDNASFSLYRGTDFAAFAGRAGGEAKSLKIPLLCDNQIKCEDGYEWDPAKFGGVAEFSWDDEALVLECTVEDAVDKPAAIVSEDGEEAFGGDMLAVALFPKLDSLGMPTSEQERWYLSLANPGGGSGKTTLFRPKKYSLGLKSGQLAKDSSVYQVDFRREGTQTIYSLRIPWTEIPGFTPAKGASFGCNLVLVDGDGKGTGRMVWGVDLSDSAAGCGIITLLP